ncbi:PepSY domain-containing protein [Rathayibacter sp. SD072]|uniref:PepSY domain-containing protein n=1 Tax=Rathayibacter sp. SD072 TaxID=2781731 RepID=UPI001A95E3F8|nr:PepSY domain-containing protein [Rathayibacter sp. SD072]MBO0983037.1 PepSY domain-containing protein [Rathayibacter sp. SD072]
MQKKTTIIAGAAGVLVLLGAGTGIAYAATDGFEGSDRLTGADLDRASEAALAEIGGGTVTSAEREDDGASGYELELRGEDGLEYDVRLDDSFEVLSADADADDDGRAVTGGAAGTGADASDAPDAPAVGAVDADDLTGDELARASEAALAAVGTGTVTEAERSDDADHAYDVEVTREDGTDVDVDLGTDFAVVATND